MSFPTRRQLTPSSTTSVNPEASSHEQLLEYQVREISYNRPSKTVQNGTNVKTRVSTIVRPTSCFSSIKDNKMSQNTSIKSRYCQEELNKIGYGKKTSRCGSNTAYVTDEKGSKPNNEFHCDVTFLRKLLAMNKKEEMVLNKRLAMLMREEEFGKTVQKDPFDESPSVSRFDTGNDRRLAFVNVNKHSYTKLPEGCLTAERGFKRNSTLPLAPKQKVEYDMNGRRIFYDSNDEEDEDERIELLEEFGSTKSKTWINRTTTVIKTKSDMSCDANGGSQMSSKRKSLTVMSQPVHVSRSSKHQGREEGGVGDERHRSAFVTAGDRWRGTAASQGDGVQNVVAHCCEVGPFSKKKVMKVWNFNTIPKLKPGHSHGDNSCIGSRETKTDKEGKNSQLKNS